MRPEKHRITVDTWFRPVSARPLAGLRVGLPLILLVHLAWLSNDIFSLHGSRGIIPWELTELLRDPGVPGLHDLAKAILPLGLSEHVAFAILLSIYAGSLLSLALGVTTRTVAFLAWGLHLSLMTSGQASFYGVDQLANTFLFYLLLFPSGRTWRFASRPAPSRREATIPVGCLRVMQAHLCVIYLAAGFDKAMGSQWWNGEAIWQAVSQPAFATFDLSWLAWHPWIAILAGWSTLVVEIGYVIFIWPRRTRRVWFMATLGLHLGIAVFMELVFFSSLMILLTGCLFMIPEEVTEGTAAPRHGRIVTMLLVAICLPPLGFATATRAQDRRESREKDPHDNDHGTQKSRRFDDLAPLVRRVMARDQIPGLAVGVVDGGDVVYSRGFGYRDIEAHLPVTPDTLFALGSCSKAFTATAIALLADERSTSLDTPIRTILPDFALEDPVASATLTTRDILTHRSGLPRHDLFWYEAPFSRHELYRRLRFLEPSGPPRTQWRYNSLMFVVAGQIVEQVSGKSWESFVRARILMPLGMRRTRLSAEAMEADSDHASPYALREGRARRIPMLKRLSVIAPAGAVQSTARDLARWLTFHATRSPPLLGEGMWGELHRPEAQMPAPAEPEVQHPYYALGWIHESYRGHPLVLHNGAIDGFTVHLGFLPETGQGLIVLMNRDLASAALMAIAYSAYDRLLGLEPIDWEGRLEEMPTPLQVVPKTALDFPLETVVGRYEHPAYGVLTVRAQAGKLIMQLRTLRRALAYQGKRRFLTVEPIVDGAPQISVRFSKPKVGEPLKLFVPLNFDEGDPVEVFTRVH